MSSSAPAAGDRATPFDMGWPFLSAFGFAQICSWGTLYYAFPQIALAMSGAFGWDVSETYGALTLGLLASAVAAVPVGIAIDRGYGRHVMTGGSVLAGGFFMLWAGADGLVQFYIAFTGIGLLQAAVLYSAAFAVIARHCAPHRVRDHITTLTLWGGFANTVFIPLIEFMMGYLDWRQVLMVLGGINILVCGGVYAFLPRHAAPGAITGSTGTQTGKSAPSANPDAREAPTSAPTLAPTPAWALMQPIFWALMICFALYAALASSFRFHLYPMLIENGLTGQDAVFILALLGPGQVAGRALMKVFRDQSIAAIGIFVAALFPLAFLAIILFPDHFPVLVAAGVTYGVAAGTMTIVKGLAVPAFLTRHAYGLINGMMNTPITVLKAFTPSFAALAWTVTGTYQTLMQGLLAASAVMLMAFVLAAMIGRREAQAHTSCRCN